MIPVEQQRAYAIRITMPRMTGADFIAIVVANGKNQKQALQAGKIYENTVMMKHAIISIPPTPWKIRRARGHGKIPTDTIVKEFQVLKTSDDFGRSKQLVSPQVTRLRFTNALNPILGLLELGKAAGDAYFTSKIVSASCDEDNDEEKGFFEDHFDRVMKIVDCTQLIVSDPRLLPGSENTLLVKTATTCCIFRVLPKVCDRLAKLGHISAHLIIPTMPPSPPPQFVDDNPLSRLQLAGYQISSMERSFPLQPRDDIQRNAIDAIHRRWAEIDDEDRQPDREVAALVVMPCNTGKTVVALYMAWELMVVRRKIDQVVVIVPSTEIAKGWNDTINVICEKLGGSNNEIANWWRDNIFVTMYTSIASEMSNYVRRKCDVKKSIEVDVYMKTTKTMKRKTKIVTSTWSTDRLRSMLILDEVHRAPAVTFSRMITCCFPPAAFCYRLGLTGTCARKDGLVNMIYTHSGGNPPVFHMLPKDVPGKYLRDLIIVSMFCEAPAIYENMDNLSSSLNSFQRMNRIHGSNELRADWIVHEFLGKNEMFREFKHIMVLARSLNHVFLLAKSVSKYYDALCAEIGEEIAIDFDIVIGKKEAVKAKKAKMEVIAKMKVGAKIVKKFTIAGMDAAGEGRNDPTIDCLVFADRALNMMQNGDRIRQPHNGAIVYISSDGLAGGIPAKQHDIKQLRQDIFPEIKKITRLTANVRSYTDWEIVSRGAVIVDGVKTTSIEDICGDVIGNNNGDDDFECYYSDDDGDDE